jgi:hypothetical protein
MRAAAHFMADRSGTAANFKEYTVATQQPEDRDTGKGVAPDAAPTAISASGLSRRRFGKAGAGVSAGVIMTLVSQPGMAQTALCVSASGAASANLSTHSDHLVPCQGVSAGFWKNHPEAWAAANTKTDTKFSAVFTTRTSRTAPLNTYSCIEVCDPSVVANGADPDNVAMHTMATLLNVRSGRIGFLTENQVLAIWNSYAQNGMYQPTVGITWSGAQIVDYLKKTMS